MISSLERARSESNELDEETKDEVEEVDYLQNIANIAPKMILKEGNTASSKLPNKNIKQLKQDVIEPINIHSYLWFPLMVGQGK